MKKMNQRERTQCRKLYTVNIDKGKTLDDIEMIEFYNRNKQKGMCKKYIPFCFVAFSEKQPPLGAVELKIFR